MRCISRRRVASLRAEETKVTCDHNCFACPYDDCIVEDESPEEAEAAERRDELDRETACKADKDRRRNTKYRDEHPEWYREYMRNYRHTHKDKIKAYKAKWYQKNRNRILAQQKEYRQRKGGTHERETGTQTEALGAV